MLSYLYHEVYASLRSNPLPLDCFAPLTMTKLVTPSLRNSNNGIPAVEKKELTFMSLVGRITKQSMLRLIPLDFFAPLPMANIVYPSLRGTKQSRLSRILLDCFALLAITMRQKLITIIIVNLLAINIAFAQTSFFFQLADSALTLTKQQVSYDPSYIQIAYPNGDVPANKGVCTDVVIRAYRKLGIDLQKEVHEDMRTNFNKYPKNWGLSRPDRNIDHRRVPNLMTFFSRFGTIKNYSDYQPGDIICWDLNGNGLTHIGIVSRKKSNDGERYLIIRDYSGFYLVQPR